MSRPLAVLRPDPGARVTAAAIEAHGRRAIRLPLFEVRPLPWSPADAGRFDALLLASANALRHAGPAAGRYADLPVYAVGEATAQGARRAGFTVVFVGRDGAAEMLAAAAQRGVRRALHLAGCERTIATSPIVAEVVATYAAEARAIEAKDLGQLSDAVVLLHSARAARRLAALFDIHGLDRSRTALAAISLAVARAAGEGWQALATAPMAQDAALVDTALALAD